MTAPGYVIDYVNAQEWLFFYCSLPVLLLAFVILIVRAFLQYLDDLNVNDDTPRKTTKMLDL